MRHVSPVVRVTGGLAVTAAILGYGLGTRTDRLTETAAIELWAAEYVDETGGSPTDCAAAPDPRRGVWLVVACGSGPGARVYPLDRNGRLAAPDGGAST